MTAKDTGVHVTSADAVEVRAEGDVDEGAVTYVREKVDAVLGRPGLPAVSGAVRVARAVAHHSEQPWSAGAELVVQNTLVVVHAQEATARRPGSEPFVIHRTETVTLLPPRVIRAPWRGNCPARPPGLPGPVPVSPRKGPSAPGSGDQAGRE